MSQEKLVWVDIETTGLDPDKDLILELGIVVTDSNLDVVNQQSWIFVPYMDKSILDITPAVVEMHTKNGLWLEWSANANASGRDHLDANDDVISDVRLFLEEAGALGLPMAGSTVHFDRKFLQAHFPEIHRLFHYRNIDVSTIKNLARIYRPKLYESAPLPREKTHRPLADLRDSIAELRHYLEGMKWML